MARRAEERACGAWTTLAAVTSTETGIRLPWQAFGEDLAKYSLVNEIKDALETHDIRFVFDMLPHAMIMEYHHASAWELCAYLLWLQKHPDSPIEAWQSMDLDARFEIVETIADPKPFLTASGKKWEPFALCPRVTHNKKTKKQYADLLVKLKDTETWGTPIASGNEEEGAGVVNDREVVPEVPALTIQAKRSRPNSLDERSSEAEEIIFPKSHTRRKIVSSDEETHPRQTAPPVAPLPPQMLLASTVDTQAAALPPKAVVAREMDENSTKDGLLSYLCSLPSAS